MTNLYQKKWWKITLVLQLSFCSSMLLGQDFTKDYKPLVSNGTIPREFISSVNEKWNEYQQVDIKKGEKSRQKKDKKEFLLESSHELDMILKSGKVTFNNEVYDYLNKLASKLLESDMELRNKLRFYPVNFETSNAFAYNEGAIFFQIGLIARSNSEAELAFIMGHEIGHYVKKHSINNHLEYKKAKRQEGEYKKIDESELLKAVRQYSREKEVESDEYGYQLMMKAGLNPYDAIHSLAGLRRTLNPPLMQRFDPVTIEKGLVVIPAGYLYTQANSEQSESTASDEKEKEEEGRSDELSTHPAIDDRIDNILGGLKVADTVGKPHFILNPGEFEHIREICLFEMCRLYLLENQLDAAFYHISVMLKKYPENAYLNKMMSITLARLAEAACNNALNRVVRTLKQCPEELIASNYMLRKMHKEELNLIALRFQWEARRVAGATVDLDKALRVSLMNYTTHFAHDLQDFAVPDKFSRSEVESYYVPDTTGLLVKDKKGKTKKAKMKAPRYWFDRSLSRFALSDLKTNKDFADIFDSIAKSNPNRKKKMGEKDEEEETFSARNRNNTIAQSKKKVEGLNISNIIMLEPEYYRIDKRKEISQDYVHNEVKELKINELLKQCATEAGFTLNLLSSNTINENDIQKLSDYNVMMSWVSEMFVDKKKTTISTDYARLKEIMERYDTRYAAILVNVSSVDKVSSGVRVLSWLLCVWTPATWPFIALAYVPKKEYTMVFGVLDMQENKVVYGNIINFNTFERTDLLKSQLHGILATLKHHKK